LSQSSVTTEFGWALYAHPVFLQRLKDIVAEVKRLMNADPDGFHHHPAYKFFEGVTGNILVTVPSNPAHPTFRQGGTLGRKYQHWFRVKKHNLPPRYRLFFQFRSAAPRTIIYAWLNDESSIRREGARNDVYEVFRGMLDAGDMPSAYADLMRASSTLVMPSLTGTEEESV
tara:strand:+ start:456 stop:968 length:513 start_codon:yes stop_codon:yes gene_type:complete